MEPSSGGSLGCPIMDKVDYQPIVLFFLFSFFCLFVFLGPPLQHVEVSRLLGSNQS